MQLAILGLLVAALVLLVVSLVGGNTTLAIFSIVVSLIAIAAIVRGRRQRQELAAARIAEAERQAKIEADKDQTTRVLAGSGESSAAVAPSGEAEPTRHEPVAAEPVAAESAEGEPVEGDDPPPADTIAPLQRHGQSRVWVIDGRPRYHLAECRFLNGSVPEPVPLSQAVEDGFTPCSGCDPDNKLVG